MTGVHVAVMTHDRSASLARLMASLDCQRPHQQVAVTILDNGSAEPHAVEVHRIAAQHGARVVRSERNLFVSGKRTLPTSSRWLSSVNNSISSFADACRLRPESASRVIRRGA